MLTETEFWQFIALARQWSAMSREEAFLLAEINGYRTGGRAIRFKRIEYWVPSGLSFVHTTLFYDPRTEAEVMLLHMQTAGEIG